DRQRSLSDHSPRGPVAQAWRSREVGRAPGDQAVDRRLIVSSVIRLRSQRLSEIPILVLVDLQQEYVAAPRITALPGAHAALRKCRDALAAARAGGIPIAFTRLQGASGFFNRSSTLFDWVDGFEPLRSEMVFDRDMPSCYSSEGFAAFMKDVRAPVVFAGFSGESACLATLVDGFHRK